MPIERLRYIAISHFEADECGSLNEFLAVAPHAEPVCSKVAAMVSLNDYADRAPKCLADGEVLKLGERSLTWFDTPHMPHAWECGLAMENVTGTLMCGDLFTQNGADRPPLTDSDILTPSEEFRVKMGYFSVTENARATLERLAQTNPRTLACMHGSAWQGNGCELLRALADRIEA